MAKNLLFSAWQQFLAEIRLLPSLNSTMRMSKNTLLKMLTYQTPKGHLTRDYGYVFW